MNAFRPTDAAQAAVVLLLGAFAISLSRRLAAHPRLGRSFSSLCPCPGDQVFALLEGPNVLITLTYGVSRRWTVVVLDQGYKRLTPLLFEEKTIEAAKRRAVGFVERIYGAPRQPPVWREALVKRFDALAD